MLKYNLLILDFLKQRREVRRAMKQGIFISYRRDTGSTMARMIYDRLRLEKHYECFLDVEKLNVGNFRENIAFEMEKCRIFLLILSRNALNRCVNQEDNVRQEIEAAMERGLEIIPVTDEDFVWPETMPEGLERIKDFNAIPYVQVYSDQFFERLYSFIDNIWAEDRAKEAVVRGERRAAKAAELSEKTKTTIKNFGQSSADTITDIGKSATATASVATAAAKAAVTAARSAAKESARESARGKNARISIAPLFMIVVLVAAVIFFVQKKLLLGFAMLVILILIMIIFRKGQSGGKRGGGSRDNY